MFLVKACTMFSAAHRIEGHPRCGKIHGHNYRVCIVVREERPLQVDLDALEEWLERNVFQRFDHQYLNKVLAAPDKDEKLVVTSEELAVLIADMLEQAFPGRVEYVEVCETENLCIEYRPPRRGGFR
ncbi:6-pyruvoyl trahydropterin synthase family protein [Hyperthermus butylicus]|uniref:6-pyruvoyl-tetrahydropterin synthase n=1 Tax=Hyperthermus butylicus (strain DSM 5456 / JCM 9403 / PLM1-5) TaxID=415426 RepID=A2BJ89_HYPBU|nr:6-carboxytetrahydropterin synthase [Hyperthermus butylicus]ABM80050.1 6-pyruvoyl-tetrahydropterin synthase [Hyperthermus butylicus DSM 5456]